MSHDAFDDRRKALEEQFFTKHNDALVNRMKDAARRAATREEIQRHTGISNSTVLDTLAGMNVGGAAALVMSMFPLVEIAWADGRVDEKERKVLLEQSALVGISPYSEAAMYLAHWLDERPDAEWHTSWASYVSELCKKLQPEARELLKNEVLGRARLVAEASGGVLGFGWTISSAERGVLDKLARAFG